MDAIGLTVPELYISISTGKQELHVMERAEPKQTFFISTSKFGIGNLEGSFKTPLGLHRIYEKIGAGAPLGSVFKDRKNTGVVWDGTDDADNLILSRILRLEGLENGLNKGEGIDSLGRYIYIHGTNRESSIGTPLSHGCICMKNNDIIALFDLVEEGMFVYID